MAKEGHPESIAAEETKPKAPATYQVSEQPSTRVQEEEFAKQLRLARNLAAASLPLEPVRQPRTPKKERSIAKAKSEGTRYPKGIGDWFRRFEPDREPVLPAPPFPPP